MLTMTVVPPPKRSSGMTASGPASPMSAVVGRVTIPPAARAVPPNADPASRSSAWCVSKSMTPRWKSALRPRRMASRPPKSDGGVGDERRVGEPAYLPESGRPRAGTRSVCRVKGVGGLLRSPAPSLPGAS